MQSHLPSVSNDLFLVKVVWYILGYQEGRFNPAIFLFLSSCQDVPFLFLEVWGLPEEWFILFWLVNWLTIKLFSLRNCFVKNEYSWINGITCSSFDNQQQSINQSIYLFLIAWHPVKMNHYTMYLQYPQCNH